MYQQYSVAALAWLHFIAIATVIQLQIIHMPKKKKPTKKT